MQEESSDDAGQRLKSPWAGLWCLGCSVASAPMIFPIVLLAGTLAFIFERIDGDGWTIVVSIAAGIVVFLMLLFLVWGFVIGGKYARWLCAFWALLALVVFIMSLL